MDLFERAQLLKGTPNPLKVQWGVVSGTPSGGRVDVALSGSTATVSLRYNRDMTPADGDTVAVLDQGGGAKFVLCALAAVS